MSEQDKLKWARRVRQELIQRLYTLDAKGIVDEELIDEVGYAIYARCESIRIATEAHAGRAACRRCGAIITHEWSKKQLLECECGWSKTWGDYLKSYQRQQLYGGQAYAFFLEFLERWPSARTPRDKLLTIDRVIHACHVSVHYPRGRPAAVNLIEGTSSELAVFLDKLAYGNGSTPGLAESRAEWQRLLSPYFPREARTKRR